MTTLDKMNKLEHKLQGLKFKKGKIYLSAHYDSPFYYNRSIVFGNDEERIAFYIGNKSYGTNYNFCYRPAVDPDHIMRSNYFSRWIPIKEIDMFNIETIILLYKDM